MSKDENRVAICEYCDSDLYSNDDVLVHEGSIYCDCDCLFKGIGVTECEGFEVDRYL